MTITERLRDAIRQTGRPLAHVARDCGVPATTLRRFTTGQNIGVRHADRLAKFFGFTLTAEK